VSTTAAFVLFLALTLLAAIAFERLVDRPAIALSRRVGIVPLVSPHEMTQK
jgi:peptidoglycan/LPS O-acetylase OafA/YrhL